MVNVHVYCNHARPHQRTSYTDAQLLRSASQWQTRSFLNRLFMARVHGRWRQLCVVNSISMASLNIHCNHTKPHQLTSYSDISILQPASQWRVRSFPRLVLMILVHRELRSVCSHDSISAASIVIAQSRSNNISIFEAAIRTKL